VPVQIAPKGRRVDSNSHLPQFAILRMGARSAAGNPPKEQSRAAAGVRFGSELSRPSRGVARDARTGTRP
jgi:hypothetical protein